MYASRPYPGFERRLNKYATTILIGGIFLCFSVIFFLSFCSSPCEDVTYISHHHVDHDDDHGYWNKKILAPKKKHSAFLVVMIITSVNNFERRDVIRKTWFSNSNDDVLLKFVVGAAKFTKFEKNQIERENVLHDDIILLPINDSYEELTNKVLEMFVWADVNIDFQYIMKADDDTFARLDIIRAELQSHQLTKYYWGFFDGRAHVKYKGKWAESDWNLCDRYLPYALGGGYILSSDLVHYLAANARYFKKFSNEDISVGAWLAPLEVNRTHDYRFDTEYKSRGCSNTYIVTHKQSIMQMREKHQNLKETGKLCNKEFKYRNSYIYNWDVAPTMCCNREDASIP